MSGCTPIRMKIVDCVMLRSEGDEASPRLQTRDSSVALLLQNDTREAIYGTDAMSGWTPIRMKIVDCVMLRSEGDEASPRLQTRDSSVALLLQNDTIEAIYEADAMSGCTPIRMKIVDCVMLRSEGDEASPRLQTRDSSVATLLQNDTREAIYGAESLCLQPAPKAVTLGLPVRSPEGASCQLILGAPILFSRFCAYLFGDGLV